MQLWERQNQSRVPILNATDSRPIRIMDQYGKRIDMS